MTDFYLPPLPLINRRIRPCGFNFTVSWRTPLERWFLDRATWYLERVAAGNACQHLVDYYAHFVCGELCTMTLQEFAALKVGDRVLNPMSQSPSTVGEITAVSDAGVTVRWGAGSHAGFKVGAQSTVWMHWEKVE